MLCCCALAAFLRSPRSPHPSIAVVPVLAVVLDLIILIAEPEVIVGLVLATGTLWSVARERVTLL
jgi:hypothetical protein